jgi:hypothetical protein
VGRHREAPGVADVRGDGPRTGRDCQTISDEKSGTDLVIVAGWTDGGHPVWIGRTDDGVITSVVVDFMSPDLHEAKPV